MSRTFDVAIQTIAVAVVPVEISDERLAEIAFNLGKKVADLAVEDLVDYVVEHYEGPSICAQCSGWGQKHSLQLGDEWEVSVDPHDPTASYHDAVVEVSPEELRRRRHGRW
jgi:hypothetical protein